MTVKRNDFMHLSEQVQLVIVASGSDDTNDALSFVCDELTNLYGSSVEPTMRVSLGSKSIDLDADDVKHIRNATQTFLEVIARIE